MPPNFVVIVTDDQSIDTLQKMPNTRSLITNGGTKFTQAIISNPLCCPSRATIFTGNYSHTTRVYTNSDRSTDHPAYGGYAAFFANGNDTETVNYALDAAGYETGLFGNPFNNFDPEAMLANGMPQGWDEFHAFTGDNPRYSDYSWVDYSAGGEPAFIDNVARYSTYYAGDQALRFISSQDGSEPFLAYFAPYGPHGPITPAPKDRRIQAPPGVSFETPAYNERDLSDKPPYIRRLPGSRGMNASDSRKSTTTNTPPSGASTSTSAPSSMRRRPTRCSCSSRTTVRPGAITASGTSWSPTNVRSTFPSSSLPPARRRR